MSFLKKTDPDIYTLIQKEEDRQKKTLMMIPSENIASRAVEEAVGSVLGNKYAEGYPGRRYYQGQEFADQIELSAINRAKDLFHVEAVNVQPHSGSPANFAVYTALLQPGETLMGLALAAGGHLTHGAKFTASSKYFNSVQYGVTKEGYIDYDELERVAREVKPKLIIASSTAYPRIIEWKRFAAIADEVGAYLVADISHLSGLIVAGAYPSPEPYVHVITTTTHKTLRGPRGAMIMVTKKGIEKDADLPQKINKAIIPGIQGGPHLNSIAGIAVALKEASHPSFKTYAEQIITNAKALATELISYDFNLVTGGTDCHLLLVDIQNKDLLGNTAAEACEAAGIVLNRNSVPFDPGGPFYPSGLRLGTPGITSRNMKEPEMKKIAAWINTAIAETAKTKKGMNITREQEKDKATRASLIQNTKALAAIRKEVEALCQEFPILETYV